jgi:hypothetical protein
MSARDKAEAEAKDGLVGWVTSGIAQVKNNRIKARRGTTESGAGRMATGFSSFYHLHHDGSPFVATIDVDKSQCFLIWINSLAGVVGCRFLLTPQITPQKNGGSYC